MNCDFSCEEFNQYRVDLPYPDVVLNLRNAYYAELISGAYAGRGSEMTAITQYTFHNLYTDEYPDVFTAMKYIAIVETIHLRLLGKLIRQLGLIPKYMTYETETYWNGAYPNSSIKIAEMLAADLEGERGAVAHYRRLINQIKNESIDGLFRRIILDEEKHIEVLTPLYDKYH